MNDYIGYEVLINLVGGGFSPKGVLMGVMDNYLILRDRHGQTIIFLDKVTNVRVCSNAPVEDRHSLGGMLDGI